MSVSNEIIKVFDALAEKLGMAIDWSSENIVPYLEQLCDKYINYEIATSVVWLVPAVVLLILGCFGIKITKSCYNKALDKPYSDWDCAAIGMGIVTGVFFLVSVIVIMTQCFDIVTCLTFPEKVILDELKTLIQSK